LNCAQIAEYVYKIDINNAGERLRYVVRNSSEAPPNQKKTITNGLRNLLRFKRVVPHLVRLLRAGGIWTVNCEAAYAAIVKCSVEEVCFYMIARWNPFTKSQQAAAYVVAACADQAELINSALPTNSTNTSYSILDLLPGGEADLLEQKYILGLADGGRETLLPLVIAPSPVFNALDKFVWKGDPAVFGHLVCSIDILFICFVEFLYTVSKSTYDSA